MKAWAANITAAKLLAMEQETGVKPGGQSASGFFGNLANVAGDALHVAGGLADGIGGMFGMAGQFGAPYGSAGQFGSAGQYGAGAQFGCNGRIAGMGRMQPRPDQN